MFKRKNSIRLVRFIELEIKKISSLLYMTEEKIVIKSVRVEFLSTKRDKFNNDISYFKIKDKNIEQKFALIIKEGYNLPWFKSENGQTILKTKSKYLKLKEQKKEEIVVVDIAFNYYKMNGVEGFYVCSLG